VQHYFTCLARGDQRQAQPAPTARPARRELRIVVLDSPSSFESELAALGGVDVIRDLKQAKQVFPGVRDYPGMDRCPGTQAHP